MELRPPGSPRGRFAFQRPRRRAVARVFKATNSAERFRCRILGIWCRPVYGRFNRIVRRSIRGRARAMCRLHPARQHGRPGTENEKMKRSWERRLAALEARLGGDLPVNRLLIPCIIRQDACSTRPNPCSFDDASPDNRARAVDLQAWRACSARRRGLSTENSRSPSG